MRSHVLCPVILFSCVPLSLSFLDLLNGNRAFCLINFLRETTPLMNASQLTVKGEFSWPSSITAHKCSRSEVERRERETKWKFVIDSRQFGRGRKGRGGGGGRGGRSRMESNRERAPGSEFGST